MKSPFSTRITVLQADVRNMPGDEGFDADIIDINTAGHDICGNKHICLPSFEAIHHLVTLLLGKVAMHLVTIDIHLSQAARDVFDLVFLSREDDDTLQVTLLENMMNDLQLLRVIAETPTGGTRLHARPAMR